MIEHRVPNDHLLSQNDGMESIHCRWMLNHIHWPLQFNPVCFDCIENGANVLVVMEHD